MDDENFYDTKWTKVYDNDAICNQENNVPCELRKWHVITFELSMSHYMCLICSIFLFDSTNITLFIVFHSSKVTLNKKKCFSKWDLF